MPVEIGFDHIEIYASRHFTVRSRATETSEEFTALCFGTAIFEGYGVGYAQSTETGKLFMLYCH